MRDFIFMRGCQSLVNLRKKDHMSRSLEKRATLKTNSWHMPREDILWLSACAGSNIRAISVALINPMQPREESKVLSPAVFIVIF